MGSLFYGKSIAQEIQEFVKLEIDKIKKITKRDPVMAIIKLDKESSLKMAEVRLHSTLANQLGVAVEEIVLPLETSEEKLIHVIQKCNNNPLVHGILVLFPLPDHINQEAVLSAISTDKELEGFNEKKDFHSFFEGKQSNILAALFEVMKRIDFDPMTSRCVFISDDSTLKFNAVIRKILEMAISLQIPITTVNKDEKNAEEKTRKADLLAVSLKVPGIIDEKYIKQDAIVVDFNPILVGDRYCEKKGVMVPIIHSSLNVDSLLTKAKYVLPTIGGVGPIALANLMRNFLHNYKAAVLT